MNFGQFQRPIYMTYTRSQNYTNMVGGEHGIQIYQSVVVVVLLLSLLSFDVFVPTNAHPLLFLDKWFVQIYLSINSRT
jgi:hypothetical protein